jgi:hypothetical protein
MTSAVRDQIIGLLGAGVSQTVAASAAGVSDGYVSQLLKEDGVLQEIALKRASVVSDAIEMDTTIQRAEKRALEKVVSMIPMARSLGEATKAFQVLNGARKHAEGSILPEAAGVQAVTILLPRAANIMIQMDSRQNIVEVAGKSIAPMPSKLLPKLAERLGVSVDAQDKTITPLPAARTHIAEQRAKEMEIDKERALSIYDDMVVVMHGVQVVI